MNEEKKRLLKKNNKSGDVFSPSDSNLLDIVGDALDNCQLATTKINEMEVRVAKTEAQTKEIQFDLLEQISKMQENIRSLETQVLKQSEVIYALQDRQESAKTAIEQAKMMLKEDKKEMTKSEKNIKKKSTKTSKSISKRKPAVPRRSVRSAKPSWQ
jgi:TolA-binding protein